MPNLSRKNITNKKGKSNLAFFKLHTTLYIISGILLVIAIILSYSVYKEGNIAKVNAEESLKEVEQIILTNDETRPPNPSGPPNMYEEQSLDDIKERSSQFRQISSNSPEAVQVETEEIASEEAETKVVEPPEDGYSTIAKIEMEKIGLNTSVLSRWSYELLDISVNKFYGPEPNEQGNFIIIGHNYRNGTHFGSLHLLEIGDVIELTDVSGRTIDYEVYEMIIIKPDEVEKLESDHQLALTLITCDTDNDYRLVVKSKESIIH